MHFILTLILQLLFGVAPAQAQGCGQGNPNCIVPTVTPCANDNRAASTSYVSACGGGGGANLNVGVTVITGGTSQGVLFNNAGVLGNSNVGSSGAFLIGQGGTTPPAFNFLSGDCTALNTGVVTCTKTNGVAFGNLATLGTITSSNVLGNFSGGAAIATAQTVPSCANDGGHALTNNAGGGFNCTVVSGSSVSLVVGTTPIASGTSLGVLYNNAGILGNSAAPTTSQLYIGQASGPALWQTPSGDCTFAANGAITCTKTNGSPFGNLATLGTITTSTVLGNFSGGAANATAQAVPSCASDGAHALTNNAAVGFNCTAVGGGGSTIGPTEQKFTSGSGTYTTPANVVWIEVRMCGGGGGGGGAGATTAPNGGNGGNTTFGTSLLVANGGTGGTGNTSGTAAVAGSPGGTASLGSGPLGLAVAGQGGGGGVSIGGSGGFGGTGGASMMGAGAIGGVNGSTAGSGDLCGGGGGSGSSSRGAAGGGAGGNVWAYILTPSASYNFAVGATGTGGVGTGTGAATGGTGGAGIIDVIEHYNH